MKPGHQLLPNVIILLIVPNDSHVIETHAAIIEVQNHHMNYEEESLNGIQVAMLPTCAPGVR
jgi:hypothetical protein